MDVVIVTPNAVMINSIFRPTLRLSVFVTNESGLLKSIVISVCDARCVWWVSLGAWFAWPATCCVCSFSARG